MRRATAASKALAATTDKSLSAVTLTKKTVGGGLQSSSSGRIHLTTAAFDQNGLAQDLEQLKKNFDVSLPMRGLLASRFAVTYWWLAI